MSSLYESLGPERELELLGHAEEAFNEVAGPVYDEYAEGGREDLEAYVAVRDPHLRAVTEAEEDQNDIASQVERYLRYLPAAERPGPGIDQAVTPAEATLYFALWKSFSDREAIVARYATSPFAFEMEFASTRNERDQDIVYRPFREDDGDDLV